MFYTKSHEWVKVSQDTAIIGITDHAQKELGDIVFLEVVKKIGDKVNAKDVISTIESVKAVSDIYLPISGKVIEINDNAIEKPDIINSNPFDEGWIIKLQLSDKKELDELLNEKEYKIFIAE